MKIDKFASITEKLKLTNPVEITPEFEPEAGVVVAVEALTENRGDDQARS